MRPRQRMKELIARRGYTMVPGAYDTLTARLVEQAGFKHFNRLPVKDAFSVLYEIRN